ncbi:MAG: putative bifunctional diguanylate cyclase/phosphodiesterase [Acidimicrobiia bacterium]
MASPRHVAPTAEEGRQWLRRVTQAVAGWSWGDLDRPLPDRPASGLPAELVELHAGLEQTRQALQEERSRTRGREILVDPLTGLANRALFLRMVQRMVARLDRHGGTGTLLLLDLDNFRPVNDELGHEAGDQLLAAVAERLVHTTRADDALARLGGDEFAVLLEGTGVENAGRLAERLLASFAEPFAVAGHEVTVTASAGLAAIEAGVDATELMRRGDVAMYVAKRAGKARVASFEPAMDDATKGRLRLEADLRRAVESDELCLHYQPLFALGSGEVVALEALLRWQHPTRGLLAPGAFIGLAEETGLIVPIGEWVLQAAATEHARLRHRYDSEVGVPVHMNVSARQFRDSAFVGAVASTVDRFRIAPGGFGIEITESLVLDETERTIGLLARLRKLGAVISVDDFGIGYSSLTYLRRFPVDVLKLDRSFIEHIADQVEARAVVKAVIRLGHDLGLTVVAEGVEEEDQLGWLREWGCDAAQGFLLARPMPAHQLEDFLDSARHV